MNLNELFESSTSSTEQLNELFNSPYGIGAKLKDKAMTKIAGTVGLGQSYQGNAASGNLANQMFNDFKHYCGTQGLAGHSTIDKSVLDDYLRGRGLDTSLTANMYGDMITTKEASDIILKAARGRRQLGQNGAHDQGSSESGAPNRQPNKQSNSSGSDLLQYFQGLSQQDRNGLIQFIRSL